MVEAGALAPFLIRAYRAIRPKLIRVVVWNRTPARAERLARAIPGPIHGEAVTDLKAAVAEANIVCRASASHLEKANPENPLGPSWNIEQ